MTNNKISNLIKVASVLLLLSGVSVTPASANDESGIAFGVHAGYQGYSGVANLCETTARAAALEARQDVRYECDRAALMGGAHIRFRIAPEHSIVAAARISGDHELKFSSANTVTIPFSVTTGSVAYEYIASLAPDVDGFLKAGYHTSDWEVNHELLSEAATGRFSGFVLGGGFRYNENLILGYEYFDAGDELDGGHAIYAGVEFGL